MRLMRVAAICAGLCGAAAAGAHASATVQTETSLRAETRDLEGRTEAVVAVRVSGEDNATVPGSVSLSDKGVEIAGAPLDSNGTARLAILLKPGSHLLQARYTGDALHRPSLSPNTRVEAQTSSQPGFTVGVAPATLTLTAGQSGSAVATITPVNAENLASPMFVTLSCSGLPDQSACIFTPENLEILPNAAAPLTSTMVLTTEVGTQSNAMVARPISSPAALAFLLPGAFALGGIAWSARRRAWLRRLSMLALVALVTLLGTTACNPRYDYLHHGPIPGLPTPAGSYMVTVAAQSSNGVSATTNTATLALTVTAQSSQ